MSHIIRGNAQKNNKKAHHSVTRLPMTVSKNNIAPVRMAVSLKYSESFIESTSVTRQYQWNLNSIYDMNRTGTGHQPLGHDQWAAFYARYIVMRAHVHIELVNTTASTSLHTAICVSNNNTSAAVSDTSEQTFGSVTKQTGTPGAPPIVFSRTYDLAKITGVSKEIYRTDDRYLALFGASPSELLILSLTTSLDGISAFTYTYSISVIQEIEMWDPIQLGQS
jgi:hypothetical protein